jgi:threonine dehydrogenase-like Zn-dependent dehydrogenase
LLLASVISRTAALEDGPAMYETFREKRDGCIKVVMKPGLAPAT